MHARLVRLEKRARLLASVLQAASLYLACSNPLECRSVLADSCVGEPYYMVITNNYRTYERGRREEEE